MPSGDDPARSTPRRGARLRELSRSLVLAEFATGQALSQAEIGRRTGLSRTTVASLVAELRRQGRIAAADPAPTTGRGRPAARYRLRGEEQIVLGVDFGHAHLAVAVADLAGGIRAERRVELDTHVRPHEALDRAAALITELLAGTDPSVVPAMVVIGVPGPIALTDPSATAEMVLQARRVCAGTVLSAWVGLDPAGELADRVGLPVLAENDANLGAIGEHRFGGATDVDNLVFVKVSSGVGAGIVLGGTLYRGSRGAAGEIGHVQVRDHGALCRCGSRGCLETVSSSDAALDLLSAAHDRRVTLDELIDLAEAGDPGTLRLLGDMGAAIGRVLATVAATLDTSRIVVGGRIAVDALVDGIESGIAQVTQPYVLSGVAVRASVLGERASLLGAVALAISVAAAQ